MNPFDFIKGIEVLLIKEGIEWITDEYGDQIIEFVVDTGKNLVSGFNKNSKSTKRTNPQYKAIFQKFLAEHQERMRRFRIPKIADQESKIRGAELRRKNVDESLTINRTGSGWTISPAAGKNMVNKILLDIGSLISTNWPATQDDNCLKCNGLTLNIHVHERGSPAQFPMKFYPYLVEGDSTVTVTEGDRASVDHDVYNYIDTQVEGGWNKIYHWLPLTGKRKVVPQGATDDTVFFLQQMEFNFNLTDECNQYIQKYIKSIKEGTDVPICKFCLLYENTYPSNAPHPNVKMLKYSNLQEVKLR